MDKFILDKSYRYLEEGMNLEFISTKPFNTLELQFIPKIKQKITKVRFQLETILVKGVSAKGIKMANREIKKIIPVSGGDTA